MTLKTLIQATGIKQYVIACSAGIENSKFSLHVNGRRSLKSDESERLRKVLTEMGLKEELVSEAMKEASLAGLKAELQGIKPISRLQPAVDSMAG